MTITLSIYLLSMFYIAYSLAGRISLTVTDILYSRNLPTKFQRMLLICAYTTVYYLTPTQTAWGMVFATLVIIRILRTLQLMITSPHIRGISLAKIADELQSNGHSRPLEIISRGLRQTTVMNVCMNSFIILYSMKVCLL